MEDGRVLGSRLGEGDYRNGSGRFGLGGGVLASKMERKLIVGLNAVGGLGVLLLLSVGKSFWDVVW